MTEVEMNCILSLVFSACVKKRRKKKKHLFVQSFIPLGRTNGKVRRQVYGTEKLDAGFFAPLFTYGNSGKHKPVQPACRESLRTEKVKCYYVFCYIFRSETSSPPRYPLIPVPTDMIVRMRDLFIQNEIFFYIYKQKTIFFSIYCLKIRNNFN